MEPYLFLFSIFLANFPCGHFISLVKRADLELDCIADDHEVQLKYIWTKNGNEIHMPNEKLYIWENSMFFKTIDEETKGIYQCFIENSLGIASSNSISISAPPALFPPESEPEQVSATEGEPLRIGCKLPDGWPSERNVNWGQMDPSGVFYPLNDSRTTVDGNGNLYFSHVVESNDTSRNGLYYACAVSSRLVDKITIGCKTILTVNVTSAFSEHSPILQFVSPPKISAKINESVSLYCIYGGKPTPKVEWRRGSQILSESRILTISNVSLENAGAYICLVGNNQNALQQHTFSLEVLVPPSFIEEPVSQQKGVNDSIEIRCSAKGVPEPKILWTYNSQPIKHTPHNSRRTLESASTIKIANLTTSDTGYYACNASNDIGYVFKDITVQVYEKTRIQRHKGPFNKVEKHGSRPRFYCEVETGDPKFLSFSWKVNDELITESSTDFLVQTGGNYSSLTVEATMSRTVNKYTCVVETPWDQDSADATLIVVDRPSSPCIASVECHGQVAKARISWQRPNDNGKPITNYAIEANAGFMPDDWYTIYDNISSTTESVQVTLKPWGNYTFRLFALNSVGKSDPSAASSIACHVGGALPKRNPHNVTVNGTEPNNLVIAWTPLDHSELYGPGFYYEVSWRIRTANVSWEVRNISNWNESKYIVEDVPPYREFLVKVVSSNEFGQKDDNVVVYTGFSLEGVPSRAPSDLRLTENASTTSATISWSEVAEDSVQGILNSYKIEIDSKRRSSPWIENVPSYELSKTMNDLTPYTRYEVRMYVCNTRCCSLPSESLVFVTAEGVPDKVQDLQIERLGNTAFLLTWKPPHETRGVLTNYKVHCKKIRRHVYEYDSQYNVTRVIGPHRNRVKLRNLTPETDYRIIVVALTKEGEGVPSLVEERTGDMVTASRLMKPDFRVEYAVSKNESGKAAAVSIQWLPCGHQKCGIASTAGSKFYIKYKKRSESSFHREPLQSEEDFQLVDNLEPFTTYYFKVVSVDDAGVESESDIQPVHVVLANSRKSYQHFGLIVFLCTVILCSLFAMVLCMVSVYRIKHEKYGRYIPSESMYEYHTTL